MTPEYIEQLRKRLEDEFLAEQSYRAHRDFEKELTDFMVTEIDQAVVAERERIKRKVIEIQSGIVAPYDYCLLYQLIGKYIYEDFRNLSEDKEE